MRSTKKQTAGKQAMSTVTPLKLLNVQQGQTSVGAKYYIVNWDELIMHPSAPVHVEPTLITYEILGLLHRGYMRVRYDGRTKSFWSFHAYATSAEAWTAFMLGAQAEIKKLKLWEAALVVADSELEKL